MKQDQSVDGMFPKHQTECGVLQLFPQANTRHTGYNAGLNWWTHFFGAGVNHAIASRGSMDGKGFEWNNVRIHAKADGNVDFYLNGELRYTVYDNRYQYGTIRV